MLFLSIPPQNRFAFRSTSFNIYESTCYCDDEDVEIKSFLKDTLKTTKLKDTPLTEEYSDSVYIPFGSMVGKDIVNKIISSFDEILPNNENKNYESKKVFKDNFFD